jgi:16S rRNA G527 N7-methylase RsmG
MVRRAQAGGIPTRQLLENLGLADEARERLVAYLELLGRWSSALNLTGLKTTESQIRVLVRGVLPAIGLPEAGRLIDVGSGNGSPGIVFAAVRDDLEVTLLEPRAKRWAFLREAARVLDRRVTVLRESHDSYVGPPGRTVTMRALSLPLGDLEPLTAPRGKVLVFGRCPALVPGFEQVAGPPLAAQIHAFRRCST